VSSPPSLILQLHHAIDQLRTGRVLVVGDMVIDEMIYGNTARLSREAPVLILHHQHTDRLLGGGGNAAHNVAALGAQKTIVAGTSGADYYGQQLQDILHRDGIEALGLVADPSRPTTTKTRISGIANQSVTQQIVRIDRESKVPITEAIEAQLIDRIVALAPQLNALLLSDYGLGVMTPAVIAACQKVAKAYQLPLTVDAQTGLERFQGVSILTPNQPEAELSLGYSIEAMDDLLKGGQQLLAKTQAQAILITRGSAGMSLFERSGAVTHIPPFNRSEVFDVTGAGDTVIATLTLALATGTPLPLAAILGNLAASIVVKRFGASVTSAPELHTALDALNATQLEAITVGSMQAV
jgi:D-glycero-beta-D-manno-heptose-7-phosphate kinase